MAVRGTAAESGAVDVLVVGSMVAVMPLLKRAMTLLLMPMLLVNKGGRPRRHFSLTHRGMLWMMGSLMMACVARTHRGIDQFQNMFRVGKLLLRTVVLLVGRILLTLRPTLGLLLCLMVLRTSRWCDRFLRHRRVLWRASS